MAKQARAELSKEYILSSLKENAKSLITKKDRTYYQLGDTLNTIKSLMKHSEFTNWLEKEIEFSHNLANKYMKIALNYDEETAVNLGVRKAYSLLSLKDDVRNEFLEKHDVANMTCSELDKLLKEMKPKSNSNEASKVKRFIKNIDSFKNDLSNKISNFTQYKNDLDEESINLIKENQVIFDKLEELNELISNAKYSNNDLNKKSQIEEEFLSEYDFSLEEDVPSDFEF